VDNDVKALGKRNWKYIAWHSDEEKNVAVFQGRLWLKKDCFAAAADDDDDDDSVWANGQIIKLAQKDKRV
jgi:hypothetical protein